MDLSALSVDELQELNRGLMADRDALRSRQLEIARELDRRAAAERVAAMTDAERQAIAHVIGVQGIPSASAVGDAA